MHVKSYSWQDEKNLNVNYISQTYMTEKISILCILIFSNLGVQTFEYLYRLFPKDKCIYIHRRAVKYWSWEPPELMDKNNFIFYFWCFPDFTNKGYGIKDCFRILFKNQFPLLVIQTLITENCTLSDTPPSNFKIHLKN